MQDFIITQKNNIWWGMFPRLTQAGFGNACSCRLHGESDMVPGTLNLALHVGDEVELVLQPWSAPVRQRLQIRLRIRMLWLRIW